MAAECYVKFRRGSLAEFTALTSKEPDTLYFLYEEDELFAELYLGDRRISCGNGTSVNNTTHMNQLKDVLLTNLKDRDILVYHQGNWVNMSIDDILDDYYQLSKPIIKTIYNDNNNTHLDLIDEECVEYSPNHGDIIIIKDLIVDDHYSYTGYIYNELMADSQWCAMNGDYSAENIYFTEDFICTENIGTIKIPQGENNITIAAKGKNLKELLSTIFTQEKEPTITNPSATIKLNETEASIEVGTAYTPSYSIDFSPGRYEYGPYVDLSSVEYYVTDNTSESHKSSDTFETFTINDDTQYQINATINYGDSNTSPQTNLGNTRPDKKIVAGVLNDIKSKTVTGYRKTFYGTLNHKNEFNVRDLPYSSIKALTDGSTFTFPIAEGTMRVVIAYPATLKDMSSVLDFNDSNSNIVSGFTLLSNQLVGGQGNYNPIEYKVYVMDFANPYNVSNKFTVTI